MRRFCLVLFFLFCYGCFAVFCFLRLGRFAFLRLLRFPLRGSSGFSLGRGGFFCSRRGLRLLRVRRRSLRPRSCLFPGRFRFPGLFLWFWPWCFRPAFRCFGSGCCRWPVSCLGFVSRAGLSLRALSFGFFFCLLPRAWFGLVGFSGFRYRAGCSCFRLASAGGFSPCWLGFLCPWWRLVCCRPFVIVLIFN